MAKTLAKRVLRLLVQPDRIMPAINRRVRMRSLSKNLVYGLFSDQSEIDQYIEELRNSGLLEELRGRLSEFDSLSGETARGSEYDDGTMSIDEGMMLYALTRKLKPQTVVETGVCSGYSSALILQAMHQNGQGKLCSIDFPEIAGVTYSEGIFWNGKGGAVVPPDKSSGWIIPERLRKYWVLKLGKSEDLLQPLLDEVGPIDIFVHDSEHSYECMMYEFNTAYPVIREGGLLISDDILWNSSFFDFAKSNGHRAGHIAGSMGLIIK